MAGNDSSTVLLLHCDGTVTGTSFPDDSAGGSTHTITANGDAQITASGKFDQGATFDGTGDWLSTANSSDFTFGTGDFCIDAWVNPSNSGSSNVFAYETSAGAVQFFLDSGEIKIWAQTAFALTTSGAGISTGSLQHIAFIRKSGVFYGYVDGVLVGSNTYSVTLGTPDNGNGVGIGAEVTGPSQYFTGVIDELRVSKGTARIDDLIDPLYISSGTPGDGFTPPSMAYSPLDGHSWEITLLRDDSKNGHSWEPARLLDEKDGHSWEITLLDHEKNGHSWTAARLLDEKDGHSWEEALLVEEKQGHSWTYGQLRDEGGQSYYFDLRDSNDAVVATDTGAPPTTSFPDLFTGLGDGDYTLYARSVQHFKNLELILDETYTRFTLVSGLIVAKFPNEVKSLAYELQPAGDVLLTWSYDDTDQDIAPDTFEVYIDAVAQTPVTYTAAGNYSTTLTGLSEVSKVFKVTAKTGTQETTGLTVTATPDSTSPDSVPFTFEVS